MLSKLEKVMGVDLDGDGVTDEEIDLPSFNPETHEVSYSNTYNTNNAPKRAN